MSASVQKSAAGTQRNLSMSTTNKVAIASAGGIPPLIALLVSPLAEVQELAAYALQQSLGENDANRDKMRLPVVFLL